MKKVILKITVIAILFMMVFSPNLLVANAAGYNYDFWKNVIPSAEGLAYQDTYYSDDISNLNPDDVENIKLDSLEDMATFQDKIYILDSKKETQTAIFANSDPITYISQVYILNQDFKKIESISELLITEEVKRILDEYYQFDLDFDTVTSEVITSEELISFYGETSKYEFTLTMGAKEIELSADVIYDGNNIRRVFKLNGEVIDSSKVKYESRVVQETVTDEEGNVEIVDVTKYYFVLDDSIEVSENDVFTFEFTPTTKVGKAPYLPYSKDASRYAIRLYQATGITVTEKGLYVADSGNSRIVRANPNENGEWVVDRVYLTPNDNVFYQVSSGLMASTVTDARVFNPQKIAVDKSGKVFCIAQHIYDGIIEFDSEGAFNRYLGKNEVVANPLKKFWTKIFSEEQNSSLSLDLPPEFTNIAIDSSGFLYATSNPDSDATTVANLVKMINTSGKDVMKRNGYVTPDGDAVYLASSSEEGVIIGPSQLVGVTVNDKGNFTVVDIQRGRLFTYDNEGNLLYIAGEQPGGRTNKDKATSKSIIEPSAIRYFKRASGELDADGNPIMEEVLLVLDKSSKSILLYLTTEFGATVNKATELYQEGIIEDVYDAQGNLVQAGAETYWRQVVKMNTNYELAYLGIGKALHRRGEYKEAMEYFKLAHNANYYSKAYAEYRDQLLSKNFGWIMTAVIMLVSLWVTLSYRKHLQKKNMAIAASVAMNEEKAHLIATKQAALAGHVVHPEHTEEDDNDSPDEEDEPTDEKKKNFFARIDWTKIGQAIKHFFKETFGYPLYILTHPIQGFTEFKQEKKGKTWVAIVIILLYVLMEIIAYQYEGIITNKNNPQKFNSIQILVYGILPPAILAVSNWSVTTLLDGKGKMKEIFVMICYAMFPVMIIGFLNIILSNILTLDEAQFIVLLNIIGWVLTGFMAFMGLVVIHEYGMGKTIWSIILTVVAALIIAFIALLVFDLAQQIFGFVYSLYKEITVRYF